LCVPIRSNKTKEVLDAVSSQCEEMETKVHQQEVASVAEMRNLVGYFRLLSVALSHSTLLQ
jgi:hypothetical protein